METEEASCGPGFRGELRGTEVTESRAREAFLGKEVDAFIGFLRVPGLSKGRG